MDDQKKTKQRKYDLSDLEEWLKDYEKWYNELPTAQKDSGTPGGPPPPPPGGGGNP